MMMLYLYTLLMFSEFIMLYLEFSSSQINYDHRSISKRYQLIDFHHTKKLSYLNSIHKLFKHQIILKLKSNKKIHKIVLEKIVSDIIIRKTREYCMNSRSMFSFYSDKKVSKRIQIRGKYQVSV